MLFVTLFVRLFVCQQYNSPNYCMDGNEIVDKENRFKFGHDWVNIFDSGANFR